MWKYCLVGWSGRRQTSGRIHYCTLVGKYLIAIRLWFAFGESDRSKAQSPPSKNLHIRDVDKVTWQICFKTFQNKKIIENSAFCVEGMANSFIRESGEMHGIKHRSQYLFLRGEENRLKEKQEQAKVPFIYLFGGHTQRCSRAMLWTDTGSPAEYIIEPYKMSNFKYSRSK